MRDPPASGADSSEESDMETTQAMEMEEIEIDLPRLTEIHGLAIINSLTIDQIHKLQSELDPVKGKGKVVEPTTTSSRRHGYQDQSP
jgi:hypothetical protein